MGEYGGVAPSFSLGSSRDGPGTMTPVWEALWGLGKGLTCRGRDPGKGGFGELFPPSYYSLSPTGPDGFLGEERRPRPALGPSSAAEGTAAPPRAAVSRAGGEVGRFASPLARWGDRFPRGAESRGETLRGRGRSGLGGGGWCQGLMRGVRGGGGGE